MADLVNPIHRHKASVLEGHGLLLCSLCIVRVYAIGSYRPTLGR
jgi:hypothetical protein